MSEQHDNAEEWSPTYTGESLRHYGADHYGYVIAMGAEWHWSLLRRGDEHEPLGHGKAEFVELATQTCDAAACALALALLAQRAARFADAIDAQLARDLRRAELAHDAWQTTPDWDMDDLLAEREEDRLWADVGTARRALVRGYP